MRYAAILGNDCLDATDGFAVSFWTQGCPFHCKGCHNQHTWDFNGGKEAKVDDIISEIKEKLTANGVQRDFSVLGGEPLCKENLSDVTYIIKEIRKDFPDIKIHLWTGYTLEELLVREPDERDLIEVFKNVDVIVDGRFVESLKDPDLLYRGSSNQRVLRKGYDY